MGVEREFKRSRMNSVCRLVLGGERNYAIGDLLSMQISMRAERENQMDG